MTTSIRKNSEPGREESRLSGLQEELRAQLAGFEERYGMASDVFVACFERGELDDATDFLEWAATVEMLAGVQPPALGNDRVLRR